MPSITATDSQHLKTLVAQAMSESGPLVDLNHIDVSGVDDMSSLFSGRDFRGDISQWDVSKVRRMNVMFFNCTFNGDISQWNTAQLILTPGMFSHSKFKGDISQWNTALLFNTRCMFDGSNFNGDLSNWKTTALENCDRMFMGSANTIDLSTWILPKNCKCYGMLGKDFDGVLPRFEEGPTNNFARYKQMFAEPSQFLRYLEKTPFSHVHAKQLMAVKTKPAWIDIKTFKAVKALQTIALEVGLNDNQVLEVVLKDYNRQKNQPTPESSYDISGLLMD